MPGAAVYSLGGNKIGDTGAKALTKALKANSALTSLRFVATRLRHWAWTAARGLGRLHGDRMAHVRSPLPGIAVYSLNGNEIGDTGAEALAEALKTNSTLATLWYVDSGLQCKDIPGA